MTTLQQHPLSAAFPSMSADDFQALKDDIENNGQREPVIVHEGMVLDGWHRYRACIELGIKPQQFTFSATDDPVAFVISHNLHRRHLTASQRAAAVVACNSWLPTGRPKGTSSSPVAQQSEKREPSSPFSKTTAQLAKSAQVSDKTIKDAKAAHRAGLTDAVKSGAMTAKEAASVARGTPAPAPKPAAPVAPPASFAPADEGPSAAEVAAAERDAAEEIAALRKIALADDKVAAAIDEAKKLRALNRVLQERNNEFMNKNSELIRMVKSLQKKLARFEKEAA